MRIRSFDPVGMSELLRMLTAQPEFNLPPVAPAVTLPALAPVRPAPPSVTPSTGPDRADTAVAATGEGDAIVDLETTLGTAGVLVRAEGNQRARHFSVWPLGGQTLVGTTKPYAGTRTRRGCETG